METIWESRWLPDQKKEDPAGIMVRRTGRFFYGGLAQLGEHLPCKQGVESSNLLVSICKMISLHNLIKKQKEKSYDLSLGL